MHGRNVRTLKIDGGIACQADGVLGPMTYSAADAGKSNIHALTASEMAGQRVYRVRLYLRRMQRRALLGHEPRVQRVLLRDRHAVKFYATRLAGVALHAAAVGGAAVTAPSESFQTAALA